MGGLLASYSSFAGATDITINTGDVLYNSQSINTGEYGTINNNGSIKNSGWLNAVYSSDNARSIINNNGSIENSGFLESNNSSTLNNNGLIENSGTLGDVHESYLINNGSISNSGLIDNTLNSYIINSGSISNSGSLSNFYNSIIRGNGSLVQTGIKSEIVTTGFIQQSTIDIQGGRVILYENVYASYGNDVSYGSLIASTLSFESGANSIILAAGTTGTFYILEATDGISFKGYTPSSTDTSFQSYFDTTAITARGFKVSFTDTFNAGKLTLVTMNVVSAVPEPEEWAMMILGLGLVGFAARRKKAKMLLVA